MSMYTLIFWIQLKLEEQKFHDHIMYGVLVSIYSTQEHM
jgi:hypothetical protein